VLLTRAEERRNLYEAVNAVQNFPRGRYRAQTVARLDITDGNRRVDGAFIVTAA
jgi:hypothetical protein